MYQDTRVVPLSKICFFLQATWHPIYDLIVAGRYPDDRICVGDVRSVDIFDANTGALECQMLDPNTKGIISVSGLFARVFQENIFFFLRFR